MSRFPPHIGEKHDREDDSDQILEN